MQNNQIYITDDTLRAYGRRNSEGVVDAATLTPGEWGELCERNRKSTAARVVKCVACWKNHREVQWMKTYTLMGKTPVVSHQPGESRPDHDYQPVEGPEHKAWNERAYAIGDSENYNPRRESWAPGRKTRADVLLTGTVTVAWEHQHSPFSATGRYSAPERNRLAVAAGRTPLWHTTVRSVRGQVPILRTDGNLPPEVITDLNHRHEFRGGMYRIEIYTCTARDGHECPDGKFSGCGKPHARGQVTAGQLDDVLRGAPVAAYMPLCGARVLRAPKFFWTDRKSYDQYLAYVADPAVAALLTAAPAAPSRPSRTAGEGHSRLKEAQLRAADAVELAPAVAAVPARRVAASGPRPAEGACAHWIGREGRYCGERAGVRLYLSGRCCPAHTPAALAGQPEPPERP